LGRFRRKKKTLPIFYTYLIVDPDGNKPLYVGKGCGDRVLVSNDKFKKETIYKFPFTGLKENDAFELERDLIEVIGRRDLGKGPLLNFTDGGEGATGYIMSEWHKERLKEVLVGRKLSEATKRRISLTKKSQVAYNKGKKWTPEEREQFNNFVSAPWKGKKLSKEHRKKLSLARKGKNNPCYGKSVPEERKRKISESLKGRKHTEKARKKMSLSHKGKIPWNKGIKWHKGIKNKERRRRSVLN
jgi:hypothetical protein